MVKMIVTDQHVGHKCHFIIGKLVGASRSKATLTTGGLLEVLALFEHWIFDFFTYKLCDTVSFGNRELFRGMIKEDHSHISCIILVYNASADINMMLGSEARPRCYPSIRPFGHAYLDISLHDGLAICGYGAVVG